MKLKVLFLLLMFLSLNVLSQEILISFEGKDQASTNQMTIDEIVIDNLTTGKSITVSESSMNLNLSTVLSAGDVQVFDTFKGIQKIYPNPIDSKAFIDFYSEGNSKSTIVAYTIQGKEITRLERKFSSGYNKVAFRPGSVGIYFIKLVDAGKSYYSKVISTNKQLSSASLTHITTEKQLPVTTSKKSTANFFTDGDVLRLTATSGTFKSTIYDSPKASKTYTFNFAENFYKFDSYLVESEFPSFVNILFSVTDENNKGVDQLENTDFEVLENGNKISPSESFRYVKKLNQVPSTQRTVIMLDNSLSVEDNLDKIKESAIQLVNALADNQEIAIYAFSDNTKLISDFTSDKTTLEAAINSIGVGFPSTNLYGSIITGLSKIENKYTLDSVEEGYLVVLTDGDDTQASNTLEQVITARGNKKVFVVGLGNDLNEDNLNQIAFPGNYINASSVDDLEERFTQIRLDILRFSNSFYFLNYLSPKRNGSHSLTVKALGNTNTESDKEITGNFSAEGFVSVLSGVYANVEVGKKYGIDELNIHYTGTGNLEQDRFDYQFYGKNAGLDTITIKAQTFWAEKPPVYNWHIEQDTIVDIVEKNNFNSIKILLKSIYESNTKLTLKDKENNYEKEIIINVTNGLPKIKILNISEVTATSAKVEFEITSFGDDTETSVNLIYNSDFDYRTRKNFGNFTTLGKHTRTINNLISNIKYSISSFGVNSLGSSFNIRFSDKIFTTENGLPYVNTTGYSNIIDITYTSARLVSNNVLHDGGSAVTERGVCFSKNQNPTINDSFTEDGNGVGKFNSEINNLEENTNYYVRAYAKNEFGISYGGQQSFKTIQAVYNGNVSITKQSDLEKYKTIKEITGQLDINGSLYDIENFNALSNLEKVGSGLTITKCDLITSIDEFSNLQSLGGTFLIRNMNSLTRIEFDSLNEVASFAIIVNPLLEEMIFNKKIKILENGIISIRQNPKLNSIPNFIVTNNLTNLYLRDNSLVGDINNIENLTNLGLLSISENNITSLSLPNLIKVNNLSIEGEKIASLDFSSLTTIERDFDNQDGGNTGSLNSALKIINTSLINLNSFTNLKNINALNKFTSSLTIDIYNNKLLENLEGLENFTFGDVNNYKLNIVNNEKLSNVCALKKEITARKDHLALTIYSNKFNPDKQDIIDGTCSN
ncbi:VWA domain-containing protein [uncultured Polaribacter sp.]|uniref:VWA domain-containing protein n=1 Tax=uncultured Polaribacter sp. TaxID=174711 RepID=UPI00263604D7|nr:VWA domain-containing protein [uncultured Polaribacter sp.]